jgi:hypothetical protein
METISKSITLSPVQVETKQTAKSSVWDTLESMRFGLLPGFLTVVTCLSAITGGFAIMSSVSLLMLVGFPTALFITTIIAVAPMRVIVSLSIITAVIDLIVLGIVFSV